MFRIIFTSLFMLTSFMTAAVASKPFVFDTSSKEYKEFVRTHDYSSLDFNADDKRRLEEMALSKNKPGEVGALMTLIVLECARENASVENLNKFVTDLYDKGKSIALYSSIVGFFDLKTPLVLQNFPGNVCLNLQSNIIGAFILADLLNLDSSLMDVYPNSRYYLSLSILFFWHNPQLREKLKIASGTSTRLNMALNLYRDWCDRRKPSAEKLGHQNNFYVLWRETNTTEIRDKNSVAYKLSQEIRKGIRSTEYQVAPCLYAFRWVYNFIVEDAIHNYI